MGKGKLKHIVHLPKAALNASDHHEFGDKFVFPETTALSSSASQPLDHVPDQVGASRADRRSAIRASV